MDPKPTANDFINELKTLQSDAEKKKIRRYFKGDDSDNRVLGVRMKHTFDLAKEFSRGMSPDEINKLLDSSYYEGRMGAVSIMDFQVRPKSVSEEYRKVLFDLYINRHDRINNWDFVDRAAPRVIGGYLFDFKKPRDILYKLANSANQWERRTAIVSTLLFIRKGETDDTFKIAEQLLNDDKEYVLKAIGTSLREAGKQNNELLLDFLEKHAARMERKTLTTAMEKLSKEQKNYFRSK